ncbi:uncharacterized protein LOC117897820 [Drosophila subobscura]|uniref:uncharacterized protein LOC117897820 n=1 Tax=Drosophila subobscura TaxID=7241 RepID=UPI00155A64B6|nr:uncharacterized protein LOC117897820 [Drosophila subobscura]
MILLLIVNSSLQVKYEFVLDNEHVLSECQDKPPGALSYDSLFDFSEMALTMSDDGVTLTGNATTVWDVKPTDRIQGTANILYFDRGTWQPTVLNIIAKNFCATMYDERQFWYKFWTRHIINADEVKENCLKVAGTKLIMEPFLIKFEFGFDAPLRQGRHKIVMGFRAFDEHNVERKYNICFEITGEFYKM